MTNVNVSGADRLTSANVICPAEALGRELREIIDAQNSCKSHDEDFLVARQEMIDDAIPVVVATSDLGILIQLCSINGLLHLLDNICYENSINDAKSVVMQAQLCLERGIEMIERTTGLKREDAGGDYFMGRETGPQRKLSNLISEHCTGTAVASFAARPSCPSFPYPRMPRQRLEIL